MQNQIYFVETSWALLVLEYLYANNNSYTSVLPFSSQFAHVSSENKRFDAAMFAIHIKTEEIKIFLKFWNDTIDNSMSTLCQYHREKLIYN